MHCAALVATIPKCKLPIAIWLVSGAKLRNVLRHSTGDGLRAEKSVDAILLRVAGLSDDVESASRLAAGKHLLEEYLHLPLILKPVAKPEKLVSILHRQAAEIPLASD